MYEAMLEELVVVSSSNLFVLLGVSCVLIHSSTGGRGPTDKFSGLVGFIMGSTELLWEVNNYANPLKPHENEPNGKTMKLNSWGSQQY